MRLHLPEHHPERHLDPRPASRRRRGPRPRAMVALAAAVAVLAVPSGASATVTTPTTSPAPVVVASDQRPALSWAPPELVAPTTVAVSATRRDLRLDPTRDYVVQMPATALSVHGGLVISGGRNVVLVGGQIDIPSSAVGVGSNAMRGLYLKNQTGTVHVEGLLISGAGLGEGINLDQRSGGVVQLQNVRVETVQGTHATNHADVLQTWAGPRQLRVDGLTGSTQYQGMFMLPTQFTDVQPELFDLRRVDLRGTPDSGYMLWRDSGAWPLAVRDVWVAPRNPSWRDGFLWPKGDGAGTDAWPSVGIGTPPGGEFVPAGAAGLAYTSPGYAPAASGASATTDATTDALRATDDAAPQSVPAPAVAPVGHLDGVLPVVGGLRVRGWAADRDTTEPIAVDVTADGVTRRVTADVARADVSQVFPDLSGTTGFDTVVPLAPGEHTVCVTAVNVGSGSDTSFGCRTATVVDVAAPVFTRAPAVDVRAGTVSTSGLVPVTAGWTVGDDVGVSQVRVTSPVEGTYPASTSAVDLEVAPGVTTVTVAAVDDAGNTGTASRARTVTLVPEGETTRVDYWWKPSGSVFLGGSALRTNRRGASMSHTFTGRSVAWVASRETNSGRAHVYVDGVLEATVDLLTTARTHRVIAFTRSWDEVGTHTVQVVVEGTSGRPTVTSDGFVTVD